MAVCILVLILLVFVGKAQVLDRLGDLRPGIRLDMTKDSLRMFTHRPVWGWGLGTFPTVYPSYRSFYTNLFVNQAHNDYAQLLELTALNVENPVGPTASSLLGERCHQPSMFSHERDERRMLPSHCLPLPDAGEARLCDPSRIARPRAGLMA